MKSESEIQAKAEKVVEVISESAPLLRQDVPATPLVAEQVNRIVLKIQSFKATVFPLAFRFSRTVTEIKSLYRQGLEKRNQMLSQLQRELRVAKFFAFFRKCKRILRNIARACQMFIKNLYEIILAFVNVFADSTQNESGKTKHGESESSKRNESHYSNRNGSANSKYNESEKTKSDEFNAREWKIFENMSTEELRDLWSDTKLNDEGLASLERFLEARVPNWRQKFGQSKKEGQYQHTDAGNMSRKEAFRILGLSPGASEADIVAAHKRIILKVHPDHEGSNELATLVNRAKDVLLGK